MIFSESRLVYFSAPLSVTEDVKCKHAIQQVRDSLKNLGFVEDINGITKSFEGASSYETRMENISSGEKIKVFIQGSYANNTNIKVESDVDVAVVRETPFHTEYRSVQPHPQTDDTFNFTVAAPDTATFKDRVESCLRASFPGQVERHNKSIKVSGNTYRKDADTVPAMRYRNYKWNFSDDPEEYIGGIRIKPDQGKTIVNYPEQHILEGRKKNVATNHSYKKQVRIMKNVCSEMVNTGYTSAGKMSSFGLESLTWNVPDAEFTRYNSLGSTFETIIQYLFQDYQRLSLYKEANGIKPLCKNDSEVQEYRIFLQDLLRFFNYTGELFE